MSFSLEAREVEREEDYRRSLVGEKVLGDFSGLVDTTTSRKPALLLSSSLQPL